ncbi:hypothetical protein quinque_005626 [Culex quinquefasciatus]
MTLTVFEPRQHSEINITISDFKSSLILSCPGDVFAEYCRILDEAGNIYDECWRTFDITWDHARFRCQMIGGSQMEEIETVVNVRVEKIEYEPQIQPQLIEVFHDRQSPATMNTELECDAPYPLFYCYLSGPQGELFKATQVYNRGTVGICRFKVWNITTGKWACGRNDNSGGEVRFIYYDVKVYDQPGRAITPGITARLGDKKRNLLCKTIRDLPINSCRLYHGKGLREGECGMQIMQLEREDFGRWQCSIKVQGRDYAISVDVIEEVISTTTIVAICIAVTLVLGFVGFLAYRKLNKRRVPYRNSVGSNSGLSMSSSINT